MSLNYKNILQEYCQKKKIQLPIYNANSTGHAHDLQWSCSVTVQSMTFTSDKIFNSKRQAEQNVAFLACDALVFKTHHDLLEKKTNAIKKETSILDIDLLDITFVPVVPVLSTQPTSTQPTSTQPTSTQPTSTQPTSTQPTSTQPTSTQPILSDTSSFTLSTLPVVQNTIVLLDLENIQPVISKVPSNTIIYCFLSTYSTVDSAKYTNLCEIAKIDSGIADAADHLMSYCAGKLLSTISETSKPAIIIVSRDRSSGVLATLLQHDGYTVTHYKTAKDIESFLEN